MKHRLKLAAIAAVSAAASITSTAFADDPLVSGGRNDRDFDENGISMISSALTTTGGGSNPYVYFNESNGFGNSRFGASYSLSSYSGSWASGTAYANVNTAVDATAFSQTKRLLDQGVWAYTDANSQIANVNDYVYALGYQVASKEQSGGDFIGTVYLSNYQKQLYSASEDFWVGPIPVTTTASVSARAGDSVSGHVWVDGIDASIGPSASAWVDASAGVGFSNSVVGASAGVKVSGLTLLYVGLNHTAKARYTNSWASGACQADLAVGSKLGLDLRTLSGRLELYATAKLFFSKTWTREIARWSGLQKYYPLLDYQANFPSFNPSCISVPAAPPVQGIVIF